MVLNGLTIAFCLLAVFVIFMNYEKLLWRILWLLILAALVYFVEDVVARMLAPFGLVVLLSIIQSIHNKRMDRLAETEPEPDENA